MREIVGAVTSSATESSEMDTGSRRATTLSVLNRSQVRSRTKSAFLQAAGQPIEREDSMQHVL